MSVSAIYYADNATDTIYRCDADGSNEAVILSGLSNPTAIAVDVVGSKLYYSEWGANSISRCNLDGTGVEQLITGEDSCRDIALDVPNSKLYYVSEGATDRIVGRANLDGSGREDLVTGVGARAIGLDLVNGWIYVVDNLPATDVIFKAQLDGSSKADVISPATQAFGLDVDATAQKMYWVDWPAASSIRRANLSGTGEEVLTTSVTDGFIYIAIDPDAGQMYFNRWVGATSLDLRRANFDGSDETVLWTKSQAGNSVDGLALALSTTVQGRWDKNIYPLGRTSKRAR